MINYIALIYCISMFSGCTILSPTVDRSPVSSTDQNITTGSGAATVSAAEATGDDNNITDANQTTDDNKITDSSGCKC